MWEPELPKDWFMRIRKYEQTGQDPMTTTASDEEIVRAYIEGAVNAQALRPSRTDAFFAFTRLTATVARLEAENERLRGSAELALVSLVKAAEYYPQYFGIGKHITDARAALARNGEKP